MKRSSIILFLIVVFSLKSSYAGENQGMVQFLREYLSIKYADKSFDSFVYVAVKKQKLYLIEDNQVSAEYDVSTAKRGLGSKFGSYKTPPGLHKIAEKVGAEVESYGIIRQKVATGSVAKPVLEAKSTNKDLITTRIMHLSGLEEGVNRGGNVDSYKRGIFIHGTHEEGLIGTPASKGCVRMRNEDVVELFERIEVGTFVVILNN